MNQTFEQRIADATKTTLHKNFIEFIKESALKNNKSEDSIWNEWKEYVNKCASYDQSPVKSEFCQWYKLQCDEELLRRI